MASQKRKTAIGDEASLPAVKEPRTASSAASASGNDCPGVVASAHPPIRPSSPEEAIEAGRREQKSAADAPSSPDEAVHFGRREQTPMLDGSLFQHEILEPMWLVGLDELESFGKLPRSSDRAAVGAINRAFLSDEHRSRTLIVFLSHRWMRASLDPSKAHPDTPGNLKHALVVEGLRRLAHGLPKDTERILLWVDWMSIDQDDLSALRRGMRSLSGYIERCDALFTPFTDEFEGRRASHPARKEQAQEGEVTAAVEAAENSGVQVLRRARLDQATESFLELSRSQPALEFFSRYASLAEYLSRGWCRLEVFLAANSKMPAHGYNYFERVSLARADRPHFFFGDWQKSHRELPEVGPKIANSVLTILSPAAGAVTVESDRQVLANLVAAFPVPLPQRESYDGATNSDGLPHGHGKKIYEDNRVYEGGWVDGEYNGEGSLLYANGTIYTGGFRNGKRHGQGTHYLSNGLRFEGHFDDEASHGPGRLFAQSGLLKVEGNKVRTKWEGEGYVEYYSSGAVCFRGSAHNNARHGPGIEYADREDGSRDWQQSTILRQGHWEAGVFTGS